MRWPSKSASYWAQLNKRQAFTSPKALVQKYCCSFWCCNPVWGFGVWIDLHLDTVSTERWFKMFMKAAEKPPHWLFCLLQGLMETAAIQGERAKLIFQALSWPRRKTGSSGKSTAAAKKSDCLGWCQIKLISPMNTGIATPSLISDRFQRVSLLLVA